MQIIKNRFLSCLLLFLSCTNLETQNSSGSGIAILVSKRYYGDLKTYQNDSMFPNIKMWFCDSLIIEEIKRVSIFHDNNGRTITQKIDHYTFVDLKNKTAYNYSSFSDTARLLKKYSKDSLEDIEGMNFLSSQKDSFTRMPIQINDTIMNKNEYKRYKIYYLNPYAEIPYEATMIAYANCDFKQPLCRFFKEKNEFNDCPIVRLDYIPSAVDPHPFSIEFEFVSNKLSPEEFKVFRAWEKNAKEH